MIRRGRLIASQDCRRGGGRRRWADNGGYTAAIRPPWPGTGKVGASRPVCGRNAPSVTRGGDSAATEQLPDAARDARHLDVERTLVELAGPLRRADPDDRAI